MSATQSIRRLGATGPASVTVLRGPRDPAQVARMFAGTQWWLDAGGRLLVVTVPGIARDDLFPLSGQYWGEGLGYSFTAAGRVPTVALGMSGQLVPSQPNPASTWSLAVNYETATATGTTSVVVHQTLRELSEGESWGAGLPFVYQGRLRGTSAGESFAGLPIEIRLMPSTGVDLVEIAIAPDLSIGQDPVGKGGELMWLATSELVTAEGGRYAVTYTDGTVAARLNAPVGSMTVTWNAQPAVPPGRSWFTMPLPVASVSAELSLRLSTSEAAGTVYATGHLEGTPVNYAAVVEGTRDSGMPTPDQAFERWWRSGS